MKPKLNILLGNNTLSLLAGSETWTYTLAAQLKKLGHEVTAYSAELGFIAAKLEEIGVRCVSEFNNSGIKPFSPILEESSVENFDLIICAHYETTKYLRRQFPNTPIIAIVHGILHKGPNDEIYPEHPVTDGSVNQYLAVSAEVQDYLKVAYGIDSLVVPNFFDLERFAHKPAGDKPQTFLVNSNYWDRNDPINQLILAVADHYGAQVRAIGQNFSQTHEVEKVLEDVDVVFGMGRSVLEGVVMGKIGVVHGRWGTGGVITPKTYHDLAKTNFSGRTWVLGEGSNSRPQLSPQQLIAQIDEAFRNKDDRHAMYAAAVANHGAINATSKILEIAEKVMAEKKA